MISQHMQEQLAGSSAVTSVGAAAVSWVTQAQPYASFLATCVSIAAGLLAIAWHLWKFWHRKRVEE